MGPAHPPRIERSCAEGQLRTMHFVPRLGLVPAEDHQVPLPGIATIHVGPRLRQTLPRGPLEAVVQKLALDDGAVELLPIGAAWSIPARRPEHQEVGAHPSQAVLPLDATATTRAWSPYATSVPIGPDRSRRVEEPHDPQYRTPILARAPERTRWSCRTGRSPPDRWDRAPSRPVGAITPDGTERKTSKGATPRTKPTPLWNLPQAASVRGRRGGYEDHDTAHGIAPSTAASPIATGQPHTD